MTAQRGWHIAVAATAVVLAALAVLTGDSVLRSSVAIGAVLAFVAAWVIVGRDADRSVTASLAFSAVLVIAAGVGTAAVPAFATFQTIAYPLLWTRSRGTRLALAANVCLAIAVGIGLFSATGGDLPALAQTLIIQAISLAFSISLGLWITQIADRSDERQRLLDELTASQNEVAALNRDAGMLGERERLAREIHDTIAQDLTGLVMLAQRAQREADPSTALALLEENARAALAETRALVAASAPVALGDGIVAALMRLGDSFGRETGVAVTVSATGMPELGRDTEVVLLRCAQEALGNVRKHARASAASIDLTMDGDSVTLRVSDDGAGFDPTAATDGFGLRGMRDRLALVGGALDVATAPTGTILTAHLPTVVRA